MRLLQLRLLHLCIMVYTVLQRRRSDRWINRQSYRRPINQLRLYLGFYNTLWQELKEDPYLFHRYVGMDLEDFNNLLKLVSPYLQKNTADALCPEERLIIALRYLVSGDKLFTIDLWHQVGESTVAFIIKEACEAISKALAPIYLRVPDEEEWRYIANSFLEKWNLPWCIGAADGKHFRIRAPPHSGSLFYNHKGFLSTVLLAACDSNYIFTLVHIGEMGSKGDSGIFYECPFGRLFQNDGLNFPKGVSPLPGSELSVPCYLVGDDAFPASKHMMKPYPGFGLEHDQRVYNYRISRAQRVIENAFGILVARFRVFGNTISLHPESADKLIYAAVCLHNFLRIRSVISNPDERMYDIPEFEDEDAAQNEHLDRTAQANRIRDTLKDYFVTPEGQVPWQNDSLAYVPEE